MKVRGYYKTALSRQGAKAVMIRRREGKGAILNSVESLIGVIFHGSKWRRSRREQLRIG